MATAIRQNPYSHNWATFAANTGDHELSVIFDNGDYRHLRMSKPGMLAWHWEIFTAPGYLAFVGDIGVQLIFRRTRTCWASSTPAITETSTVTIRPSSIRDTGRRRPAQTCSL